MQKRVGWPSTGASLPCKAEIFASGWLSVGRVRVDGRRLDIVGPCQIDIAEVTTEGGKLYLFVAID